MYLSTIQSKLSSKNTSKIREVDLPSLGLKDVEISVKSAGLNFYDNYVRHGLGEVSPPCPLGLECAGVIRKVGSEVKNLKEGDHVIVHCPEGGAFSDIVITEEHNVVMIPNEIEFDVAAALTVNYLTSYFALIELGRLCDNSIVVIQGAAGGVGWAATQIAKLCRNVKVVGISSASKHEDIIANGVDLALSYEQDIHKEIQTNYPSMASIVLESTAGESLGKSLELLAPFGKVIIIGAKSMSSGEKRSLWNIFLSWWQTKNISPYQLIMGNFSVAGFHLNNLKKSHPEKFMKGWLKIVQLLNEGKIAPKIDSMFVFDEAAEGCRRMSERRNIGKIILRPQ